MGACRGGGKSKRSPPPLENHPNFFVSIWDAFLLPFLHMGIWGPFCYVFLLIGGLFYHVRGLFLNARAFFGLAPPPPRKFLRAPMIEPTFHQGRVYDWLLLRHVTAGFFFFDALGKYSEFGAQTLQCLVQCNGKYGYDIEKK